MNTESITEYPEGALLRVTETHRCGKRQVDYGTEFEVSDFISAKHSEDGVPFYWGSNQGGMNNVVVLADKVELVKTPEQMRARTIPTAEQIIGALHCLDDYDGFEITEADRPDGNSREISGVTADGLFFACTITVSNVYQADF